MNFEELPPDVCLICEQPSDTELAGVWLMGEEGERYLATFCDDCFDRLIAASEMVRNRALTDWPEQRTATWLPARRARQHDTMMLGGSDA